MRTLKHMEVTYKHSGQGNHRRHYFCPILCMFAKQNTFGSSVQGKGFKFIPCDIPQLEIDAGK